MKSAGKKLTAAVLAGLMSVAMVGGAQAANQIKTVDSNGLGSRANLSLRSDGRAVLEAVKGNPNQEQRGFFDASVTTATVGTTSGRDATQNHGTLSTGVGSVKISAAQNGKTSEVKTTAAGGTVFSSAADSNEKTTTVKGGTIDTNIVHFKTMGDGNGTYIGNGQVNSDHIKAKNGVIDQTTQDSTTENGVVKAANTVGQNLSALDTQLAATTATANSAADGTLTLGSDYYLKKKTANGDGTYSETNVKGLKVDGNVVGDKITAGGHGIYSYGQVTGKRGFIDQTTKDSTTENGVVKAANTVGQNLNALDTAVASNKQAIEDAVNTQNQINGTLTTAVQNNSKAIVATAEAAQNLEKHLGETDGRVDKANAEIHTNAGNIAQNKADIATNKQAIEDAVNNQNKINETQNTINGTLTTAVQNNSKAIVATAEAAQNLEKHLGETDGRVDKANQEIHTNAGNIAQNKLDIAANKDAIETEATVRAAADQALQEKIASNTQAIGTTNDGNYVKSDNSVGENLNALDAQVGQNSSNIDQLFNDYSSMKKDLNKVGARSAALAGLHAVDYDPANKLSFAVASGNFRNANSVAVGAFYRPNENIMFSAASTMGDSDNAYTFGVSFKLGPSTAKAKTAAPDTTELYKVIGQLQDQLAAQQKEIDQLKADKAK